MESYIITLHADALPDKLINESNYDKRQQMMEITAKEMIQNLGLSATIERVYGGAFFGFVITASAKDIEVLENDPGVKYIEKDQGVSLQPPGL